MANKPADLLSNVRCWEGMTKICSCESELPRLVRGEVKVDSLGLPSLCKKR